VATNPPKQKTFDRSIIEGPIGGAVWRLAWPTMLQNVIAGLQGIIDHAMVGHFVGYTANAAIGVSWQIMLVVIVFISSVFSGMGVLVARFAGANQPDKVNRVVYQSFLTALFMGAFLAAVGYVAAPSLLSLVNASPEVAAEALPFLRMMLVGITGMMMFFMLSGAFRAAGDARTPLHLGLGMTLLTIVFNVVLIPKFGTVGAAFGTIASSTSVALYGLWYLTRPGSVIHFERGMDLKPDLTIIRSLFRFGLPTGVQGIAMNVGGVFMLRFIGSLEHSAAAQATYAVCYTELFSLITWTSTGQVATARRVLGRSLAAVEPWLAAGVPVVGLEPSCTAALRADAAELLPDHPLVPRLATGVRTFAELLAEHADALRTAVVAPGGRALVQVHCHQHAELGTEADRAVMAALGVDAEVLDSGCCGLAGNFGFEKGHYAVSMACAERVLLPAVRAAAPDVAVLADGFSCRTQLRQAGTREPVHLAQLAATALGLPD